MRLILTRHGETLSNLHNICEGHSDGQLSEEGILQAKKLAERLKNERIDICYASDLKRVKDTVKEIMKFHKGVSVKFDKLLRERYFGRFQGKPFPESWDWDKLPDGVETDESLCSRAKKFLDKVYSKHKNDHVLVVSHAGINMGFLTVIQNKPVSEFTKAGTVKGFLKNTSVSIFDIEEDSKHIIHVINCTKHLK